jgi:DNA replication and repair protein RecF
MNLCTLRLYHFRNYSDVSCAFNPHINVIVGPNAQGKTNLLEAVFFLSRGYSHRTSTAADLVQFAQDGFALSARVEGGGISHTLGARYDGRRKTRLLDGKKEAGQEELSRVLGTILFEPEDLRIVKAGPEKRRRFMDEEMSGFSPNFQYVSRQYKRVLHQRNALLRQIREKSESPSVLDSWDGQLVELGTRIMLYRIAYLKKLGRNARQLHNRMSDQKEELSLFYQNNILTDLSDPGAIGPLFTEKLREARQDDIDRGTTGYGPHVDDLIIHIDGKEARKFASQGQQRTAAISLKLSQIDIYKESTGSCPVVLLDDVLSELDSLRQENILALLGQTQAFITCTDDSFACRYDPFLVNRYSIAGGTIENEDGGKSGR